MSWKLDFFGLKCMKSFYEKFSIAITYKCFGRFRPVADDQLNNFSICFQNFSIKLIKHKTIVLLKRVLFEFEVPNKFRKFPGSNNIVRFLYRKKLNSYSEKKSEKMLEATDFTSLRQRWPNQWYTKFKSSIHFKIYIFSFTNLIKGDNLLETKYIPIGLFLKKLSTDYTKKSPTQAPILSTDP